VTFARLPCRDAIGDLSSLNSEDCPLPVTQRRLAISNIMVIHARATTTQVSLCPLHPRISKSLKRRAYFSTSNPERRHKQYARNTDNGREMCSHSFYETQTYITATPLPPYPSAPETHSTPLLHLSTSHKAARTPPSRSQQGSSVYPAESSNGV
jgi:hypothetical protein